MLHVIPQSWAHWHILVSLLPSVGLFFALCLYGVGMYADKDIIKRACLIAFVVVALATVPTYLSGDYTMAALAQNPKFSEARMESHFNWSVSALFFMAVTGIAALLELVRSWHGRPTENALHLVLGLGLVTLALMMVAGELGWQISHHELRLDPAEQKTSQLWSHAHIILNHFPTVGFVLALGVYVGALVLDNLILKRAGLVLFVVCAILVVPTYVTGNASMWQVTDPPIPGISKAVINTHRDMALLALFGMAFTGVTAWIELWRFRHLKSFSNLSLYLVLAFAVVTFAVLVETGHRGGQINHPEIVLPTDVLPTDPRVGWTPWIELEINQVVWFVPWQTLHFFGFSLVFGVALATSLRVLGLWKSMSFAAVHRLLPIGVFGVVMNVFSGMLILQADSSRYLNAITFVPKIIFLTIGALAVLYYSLSERLWAVKPGEEAPMGAKWVAALVLASWSIVIMGGRLLPYF
jgi:uncharacterized membrane protein